MDVRPCLTFSKPSSRSRRMPAWSDAALEAAVGAASATRRLVGLEVEPSVEAGVLQHAGGDQRAALARGAQRAGEALGDDAVDRRGDEERLDAHLDQPGDGR